MIASSSIVSCHYYSSLPLKLKLKPKPNSSSISPPKASSFIFLHRPKLNPRISKFPSFLLTQRKPQHLQTCWSSPDTQTPQEPSLVSDDDDEEEEEEDEVVVDGNGGEERDWTTSILLFTLWSGLMYYVFLLAPDQTPVTDMYFLKKLLNLAGDDGFQLNEVLVALWYIMGLWPLVYSMLLLPTARSYKSKIPVWPFVSLSFIGGAYALIPYFVLWRPPAPPVEESELKKWPLNFLESKLTAGITMAAGLGIIGYACLSGGDAWKEFYQYFRGSKFIHVTSIDFMLMSTFAPFWVYNDMTARKWYDKGFWLLPLSLVPFLGPALYLLLRPSLPATSDEK